MRPIFACCLAAVVGCKGGVTSADPAYQPLWNVGDSWTVKYSIRTSSRQKVDAPDAIIYDTAVYNYSVVSRAQDDAGSTLVIIKAREPNEPAIEYRLVFNEDTRTLVKVTEQEGEPAETAVENPFGADSWKAVPLKDFAGIHVIYDFAKLPVDGRNETRQVQSLPGGATPGFTQTTTFESDRVTVVFTRSDSATNQEDKTTIVWEKGKKWWTSAEIKLGPDVLITGTLVP